MNLLEDILDSPPLLSHPEQDSSHPSSSKFIEEDPKYIATGKLKGKVAIVTGGNTGIGKAAAILFAKEGAELCLVYLDKDRETEITTQRIRELGQKVIALAGDVGDPAFCAFVVKQVLAVFGRIDILVNNAGEQRVVCGVEDLDPDEVKRTFDTNLFGPFHLTRAAISHLGKGSSIINTTSAQAHDPSPRLMDYACSKAALLNFTVSLAREVAGRGIRVNAVAPGPILTPMTLASFNPRQLVEFGTDTLLKRAGQPAEVAPSFVFLASERDSSYMTGQVLHPNGG